MKLFGLFCAILGIITTMIFASLRANFPGDGVPKSYSSGIMFGVVTLLLGLLFFGLGRATEKH